MPPPWREAPAITEATHMKKVLVALMFGMGLLALGAGCKDEAKPGDAKSDSKAADSKADSKSGGDSIGVAECDDYFKALDACVGKNPAMKSAMETSKETNRKAWKQAASTPQGKEGLKTGCKAATDALKQSCP
jgi:hypothetical protein